jgi:hypothetical protein
MELAYNIVWLVAFTINFCVAMLSIKQIVIKWFDRSLQNILEEKRISVEYRKVGVQEALALRGELREVNYQ